MGLTITAESSGVEVVQDVSLELAAGEVLGLVGESGSGKTTLALGAIGYARRGLRLTAGSVLLDGSDLLALPPEALRQLRGSALAYVPQDPGTALNPSRRVGPQLREALTFHGHGRKEADRRILELLREVGLDAVPTVLDGFPHQLSGGQQQRVAIAMAFACRPALIVLDEPTTGLDVTTQRTVLETTLNLCSQYGVAAIYVSHDVAVVAGLAHRVAVLYSGRVVEVGPVADVFHEPAHPYTQGLLRSVPSPDRSERLVGMEGVPPRLEHRPFGCTFAPRCPIAMPQCSQELPDLVPTARSGHLARCLRTGEVRSRSGAPTTPAGHQAPDAVPTTMTGESPVLRIIGLDAHYASRQVLHRIDLAVPQGSCVAVVGESGSGKTTLARCVVGLHRDWDGEIDFEGRPLTPGIRHRTPDELRKLQYIFQNPYASLNPRRSIGGLVAQPVDHFTLLGRQECDEAVLEALRSVSLSVGLVNRYPDQLSGGERQRVAIARTLVVGPSLLVCDEVTSALDVSVQASVIEMLRTLQREQSLSLLFITHNLGLVRSIAQQVVVMQLGRVVESGPVEQVLDHPQHEYTRQLIADIPKHWSLTSH